MSKLSEAVKLYLSIEPKNRKGLMTLGNVVKLARRVR